MKARIVLLAAALFVFSGFASAAGPSTNIDIQKMKTEPVPIQTAEYADVWLKVTNDGSTRARNLELNFVEDFPFTVTGDGKTRWEPGSLTVGEEYYLHVQVRVDENAVQGENYLKFNYSTSDDLVVEEKVPVQVRTDDPVLSIEDVSFPQKVAPGSTKQMEISLENMADSQLRNLEVSLDIGDDSLPFAASDTTTKRMRTMERDESRKLTYTLQTGRNAENGLYKIPIGLEFENEAGTEFTKNTLTGVLVGGEPELEVAINSREVYSPGSTGTVTFRVINRGYGEADFVELSLPEGEGYEIVSKNSVYLGNMGPDDYQTAEFKVHASSDSLKLPVELSYKTSEGAVEETREVPINLYSGDQLRRYGLSSGSNTWIIALVAVVLAVGGVYYWKRRKNRER